MKDQLIEGKSESIKMQFYEHRLDNLPSEKEKTQQAYKLTLPGQQRKARFIRRWGN